MPSYTDLPWYYNVNDQFATNSEKFVSMANTLLAAGWTVVDRSDGTTVSVGGQNSAANWNNNNAWERYRQPDGQRDLTIQRGTTDRSARMYLGRAGILFTGGTATVPPTAATAFQIVGSSNNFNTSFFNSTANAEYCHFSAKSTADGATADVYPFYLYRATVGTPPTFPLGVYLESVTSPAGIADVEPWVSFENSYTVSNVRGWYLAGLGGAVAANNLQCGFVGAAWSGLNPYVTEDDLSSVFAFSNTVPLQRKGQLINLLSSSVLRANGDTFNLATPGQARINWGTTSGMAVPWPSGVTPLL